MTTQVIKKTESRTDVAQETSRFTVGVIMTMAGIIGIWAVSCLIGGLASGSDSRCALNPRKYVVCGKTVSQTSPPCMVAENCQ